MVGSTVKEGSGLGERSDQVLRPKDPADTPARKAPVLVPYGEPIMLLYFDYGRLHLGETVHDDDGVSVEDVRHDGLKAVPGKVIDEKLPIGKP